MITSGLHPVSYHIYASCVAVFMRPGYTRIQMAIGLICTWDVPVCVCVYMYMYVHVYVYTCVYVHMCVYICVYICVYVCVYVYIHICLYIFFVSIVLTP